MQMNLPNSLTLARIAMIPIFGLVFFLPVGWSGFAAASVFALAAVTDWLDGWLARRLQQTSAFGAFLDPVADKLMVAVALVALVAVNPSPLFALPAAVIIGREIAVSALREWMAELGKRATVAVSVIGKFKTGAQMVAIIMLLYGQPVAGLPTAILGLLLLYIAAALTLWSMIVYLRAAWLVLEAEPRERGSSASET
ncbi:CDP-diacylglycerol--glycerol-3-phosphate 3-phosphatidyltransferase [Aquisalimonas lutea]|uniref:CDP-diacylglycerol--glycerol-3-phosphate 3-phosphatidyltransferase n=1 Tax=Aquisalimonas lutea TaxID=1327750 RepID=UPI0025B34E7F|nr:CDP-diacylglycerol--glycerol-3-phosphate 3-phosphatidyltransferase [Aquisalimonas lutea]MDN3518543.1 CDP-diacylglycerol--glycerol-3-phosphate 3-phosphatidyltransferase [Aquisalimonas lutea]